MMDLPLEIREFIAEMHPNVCYKLWLYGYLTGFNPRRFRELFILRDGMTTRVFGQLHSVDDEPSQIANYWTNWHYRGKLHRDIKPARAHISGSNWWYDHGDLHRTGGPAVEYVSGMHLWYDRGVRRPAPVEDVVIYSGGTIP